MRSLLMNATTAASGGIGGGLSGGFGIFRGIDNRGPHRSPAVWLYYRFALSFREVEDLLAHRGITVSYESIRHWCETFGLAYARRLRHRAGPVGDTWHLDEFFVTIRGQRQYLWRAVDQDGEVIDILLQ